MKKRFLAFLLVLCCVCLSSCTMLTDDSILSIVADKASETGADVLARQFIDGLLSNNLKESHSVFVPGVEMEQVIAVFPPMQAMLPDSDTYTLTPIHWSTNTSDGVTMNAFQFHLLIADELFLVETLQMAGVDGLYNIHIAPYSPENEATTGTSGEINAAEIAFQLFALAAIILIIWALVDCCRHKFKRRWLWILLIIFGNILIFFAMSSSRVSFNFRLGFYMTTNYLSMYENGFAVQWLLPVGSLVYMLRRKYLLQPPAKGFSEAFAQPEQEPASAVDSESTD